MVVVTDPRINERRQVKEALIRLIDLAAYVTVIASGVFALWLTPTSVLNALNGLEWLILLWGHLLFLGGIIGFVGRLSRIWVIEIPGASAGIAGMAIYFVILAALSMKTTTALVAVALVAATTLFLLRRYVELQIFTSEPGARSFSHRLADALLRRTANFPPRSS